MTNVYDILNKELDRLHEVVRLSFAVKGDRYQYTDMMTGQPTWANSEPAQLRWALSRIDRIHEMIFNSYQANDKELQMKIAEMTLIEGSKDETVPPRKS